MNDVEQRLSNLRKKIEEAKLERAKSEREKELAEEYKTKLLTELREKYKVNSVEKAKELLSTMIQKLNKDLSEAEDKLSEYYDG